jgi:hypothetical protein
MSGRERRYYLFWTDLSLMLSGVLSFNPRSVAGFRSERVLAASASLAPLRCGRAHES